MFGQFRARRCVEKLRYGVEYPAGVYRHHLQNGLGGLNDLKPSRRRSRPSMPSFGARSSGA